MTEKAEPMIQSRFCIALIAAAAYLFVYDKKKGPYRQAGDGDNEC